jgi:peptidoglycan/LPS O-acetylase OafA/YrhL
MMANIAPQFGPVRKTGHHRETQREVRLPYLPALDGLRALAALVVLFYHADMPWMPGGFLGVEVFFVLSGYLITSLLLAEWRRSGHVNLLRFGLRRARRLFPAMLVMVAASAAFAVLFLPDEVAGLRRDAVSGLGYVTNWHLIFSRTSYFESVGRPSLLRHLWSLAIEGQLYIFWPIIFALLIRRWKGRWVPIVAILGAIASALWMAFLYQPDGDPSRVYYGTDTRCAGFLLGAALAFVPLADRPARRLASWFLDFAGLASLGLLVLACIAIDAYQPFLYRGGFAMVAIATILVISAVTHSGTRMVSDLLGCGPLRWIGQRSYGIYLWHWPVFMLTRPQLDLPLEGAPLLVLRFALTFVLTELSYRCVEKPLHDGALGRARRAFRQAQGTHRWRLALRWGGVFLGVTTLSLALGRAVVNSQPATPSWYGGRESVRTVLSSPTPEADRPAVMPTPTIAPTFAVGLGPISPTPDQEPSATPQPQAETPTAVPTALPDAEITPAPPLPLEDLGSSTVSTPPDDRSTPAPSMGWDDPGSPLASALSVTESVGITLPVSAPSTVPASTPEQASAAPVPSVPAAPQDTMQVVAVGDSVMVSAADELTGVIDQLSMDAAIGRQIREVIEVLQAIADAGRMGNVVIIQVGNNGYLSAKKFDEMMQLLKDVQYVYILNCRVPRQWETTVNTVLAEGVTRHPNATLIDWYAASADHPEFFWNDGMHLRPEGAKAYTELIVEQLSKVAP